MVKIRLRRIGRKKLPIYQVVATDSRKKRDGAFIEDLGRYEPTKTPHTFSIKEDRVLYWLNVGAQPTDTVRSIIRGTGLLYKRALQKQGKSEVEIVASMENWKKKQDGRLKRAVDRKKANRLKKKTAEKKTEETPSSPAPAAE